MATARLCKGRTCMHVHVHAHTHTHTRAHTHTLTHKGAHTHTSTYTHTHTHTYPYNYTHMHTHTPMHSLQLVQKNQATSIYQYWRCLWVAPCQTPCYSTVCQQWSQLGIPSLCLPGDPDCNRQKTNRDEVWPKQNWRKITQAAKPWRYSLHERTKGMISQNSAEFWTLDWNVSNMMH